MVDDGIVSGGDLDEEGPAGGIRYGGGASGFSLTSKPTTRSCNAVYRRKLRTIATRKFICSADDSVSQR